MPGTDAVTEVPWLWDPALALSSAAHGPGDDDDDDETGRGGGGGGGGGNIDPDDDEGYDGDEDDDDEEPWQVARVCACCIAAKRVTIRRMRRPAVLTVARRKVQVSGNRIIGF